MSDSDTKKNTGKAEGWSESLLVMGKGMPMPAFARPLAFFGNAHFAHALIILNGQMPALPMPVLCVPGQPEGRSWH